MLKKLLETPLMNLLLLCSGSQPYTFPWSQQNISNTRYIQKHSGRVLNLTRKSLECPAALK